MDSSTAIISYDIEEVQQLLAALLEDDETLRVNPSIPNINKCADFLLLNGLKKLCMSEKTVVGVKVQMGFDSSARIFEWYREALAANVYSR